MILKVFIIAPGGILCCSIEYFGEMDVDIEIVSGFLTGISDFASEIKGGKVRTLNFRNYKVVYSYSTEFGFKFVLIIEKDDIEEEAKLQLELLKNEFIKRYRAILPNWNDNISLFNDFKEFIAENIYIPPKILVTGEKGTGKTSILELLSGESILDIDDDLNEILKKKVDLNETGYIKHVLLYEIDIEKLIININPFRTLFESTDVVLVITNSAGSNLGRTSDFVSKLRAKYNNKDFYIIANFQDMTEVAFKPSEIEEQFKLKTYGLTAIEEESRSIIMEILKDIIKKLVNKKKTCLK
ncbi:MAG: hypothetical protein ACFFE4_21800 [Candidatus Thorarchaeota archaeon]